MDAEAYLINLPSYAARGAQAFRPGLAQIRRLLAAMGDPHRAFQSIHVAGTNGKGSTCSMIAAIAAAAGLRVGLHTSPHLFGLTERFRLNGTPAPRAWLEDAVARYHDVFEAVGPSFFEATVALSFRYFADVGVDLAVVEVGLGGRLDATNIITPRLAVITHIGLDHTQVLGDTLPAIAREKAGIIKPGVPVVSGVRDAPAAAAIRAVAEAQGAPYHAVQDVVQLHRAVSHPEGLRLWLETPVRRYDALPLSLAGAHQQQNAQVAVRAAELALAAVQASAQPVYDALADVHRWAGLRGRLEVMQQAPLVVADVAHNPAGLAAALAVVRPQTAGRLFVCLGLMRDKDADGIAALLAEAGAVGWAVAIDSPRAMPTAALQASLAAAGVPVGGAGDLAAGLVWFHQQAHAEDTLLIVGSHQVVAQWPR